MGERPSTVDYVWGGQRVRVDLVRARERLEMFRPLEVAVASNVGERTLRRFFAGEPVSATTLMRILRGLRIAPRDVITYLEGQ